MAKRPLKIPDRSEMREDTPLRLEVAAALAFPDGGVTVSGLRRERDAGRLATFFVAGKEFTTLKDIASMVATCRGRAPSSVARGLGSGSTREEEPEFLRRFNARLAARDFPIGDPRRQAAYAAASAEALRRMGPSKRKPPRP
ncbi:excisionase [Methylobacterium sp. CCH5-D2]|uniref:excisionase n=1 Tax=Methylobacterium sp. CCH5-D2 TaxID=1768765 RepID=UPI000A42CB4B|nr:excisionase [Methylobacterium sp. CCH5-D2]